MGVSIVDNDYGTTTGTTATATVDINSGDSNRKLIMVTLVYDFSATGAIDRVYLDDGGTGVDFTQALTFYFSGSVGELYGCIHYLDNPDAGLATDVISVWDEDTVGMLAECYSLKNAKQGALFGTDDASVSSSQTISTVITSIPSGALHIGGVLEDDNNTFSTSTHTIDTQGSVGGARFGTGHSTTGVVTHTWSTAPSYSDKLAVACGVESSPSAPGLFYGPGP